MIKKVNGIQRELLLNHMKKNVLRYEVKLLNQHLYYNMKKNMELREI